MPLRQLIQLSLRHVRLFFAMIRHFFILALMPRRFDFPAAILRCHYADIFFDAFVARCYLLPDGPAVMPRRCRH